MTTLHSSTRACLALLSSSSSELDLFLILSSTLKLAGVLWALDKAGKAGRVVPIEFAEPLVVEVKVLAMPLSETIGTCFSVTRTLTPGELVELTTAFSE